MRAVLLFACLGLALSSACVQTEVSEPEPIVIGGEEYYPLPDKEMREAGFDVPEIPPDENAAFIYYEAINAYWEPERGSELRKLRDAVLKGRWTKDAEALTEYLDKNKKALELVKKATSMPDCYFPAFAKAEVSLDDYWLFGALLPHLSKIRQLVHLLLVCGKQQEFSEHADQALRHYLVVPSVARHAARGPFLIDGVFGVRCNTMGLQAIETCILRNDLNEETLADTQKRLHAHWIQRPQFDRALANERAFTYHSVKYTLRNPDVYKPDVVFPGGGLEAWRRELEEYDVSPEDWQDMMRADLTVYWQVAEDYFEMPLHQFLAEDAKEKLDDLVSIGEGERPLNTMSLFASSFCDARIRYGRSDLYWTVLDVELALLRYKAKHGRYPYRLGEARKLMLSDGIDPFSGKPLKYRLEDDGSFTIWSVGNDLVDDGGKVEEIKDLCKAEDYVWNSRLLSVDPEPLD